MSYIDIFIRIHICFTFSLGFVAEHSLFHRTNRGGTLLAVSAVFPFSLRPLIYTLKYTFEPSCTWLRNLSTSSHPFNSSIPTYFVHFELFGRRAVASDRLLLRARQYLPPKYTTFRPRHTIFIFWTLLFPYRPHLPVWGSPVFSRVHYYISVFSVMGLVFVYRASMEFRNTTFFSGKVFLHYTIDPVYRRGVYYSILLRTFRALVGIACMLNFHLRKRWEISDDDTSELRVSVDRESCKEILPEIATRKKGGLQYLRPT